jgi:hypothetical protein
MEMEAPKKVVPEPKRGGTFLYCPHMTVELVKVAKKRKPQEVITRCKFRTRNIRKYRRHFIRMHPEQIAEAA